MTCIHIYKMKSNASSAREAIETPGPIGFPAFGAIAEGTKWRLKIMTDY